MIYKYYDEDTLQPVTDRTLKFATIEDLNDPFECLAVIESREMRPEDVPLILDELGLLEGYTGPLDQKLLEELAQKFNENSKGLIAQTGHNFSSILNQISVRKQVDSALAYGILSFSTNPKSGLMWSHYCNKHKGYVLGFDKDHDFFRGGEEKPLGLGRLNPVDYREKRIEIGNKEDQGSFLEIMHRKSDDWAYEHEIRMVMPLKYCKSISPSLHVLEYPKEALKRVIFGFYCPPNTVDEIKTCLSESKVEYLRAVPSSVSFDMELMPEEEFFRDQDSYLKASRDELKPIIDRLRSELSQP